MGVHSIFNETSTLVLAAGITAASCFAITLLAWNTDFDVTKYGRVLTVMLLGLIISSLVLMFVNSPMSEKLYAGAGALLFMGYLAYDTQRIMGGKSREINPDEYVYACIVLYIDIIIIFQDMLRLMSDR